MAVTFDNVATAVGNGTQASVNLTVAANTLVLVGVHFNGGPAASNPTFGGSAMTLIDSANDVYVYRINNTTSGTKAASVTRSDSGDWAITAISHTLYDTSNPVGTAVVDAADETSPSEVTGIGSGSADWQIVDFILLASDAAMAVSAGQTQRVNQTSYNGGVLNWGVSTKAGAAGTSTMGWTTAGTIFGVGHVAVGIRPSAAAGGSVTVDHAQAVFAGQAMTARYTAPLISAQAVMHGQNVGAISGGGAVGSVVHGQATFEGQQIPFIWSVPGEEAQVVGEGGSVNFEIRIKGFFADATWQGQTVGTTVNNSRVEPVLHAQGVFAGSVVNGTSTGVVNVDDMVEDFKPMLRPMTYTITDTDSR